MRSASDKRKVKNEKPARPLVAAPVYFSISQATFLLDHPGNQSPDIPCPPSAARAIASGVNHSRSTAPMLMNQSVTIAKCSRSGFSANVIYGFGNPYRLRDNCP
jgi:hypothetical protein